MPIVEREIAWDRLVGPCEEILWADIQKLDALWRNSPIYIPAYGNGNGSSQHRYSQIGKMIMGGNPVKMREIGGDVCFAATGYIGFINGAHRFSWIRDHGGIAIPVLIDREYCLELKRRLATTERVCRFVGVYNQFGLLCCGGSD
jgi:hypothetical protein